MNMKVSCEIQKPIEKWSNRDFVIYFSNRLFVLTKKSLDIPPPAWIGFCGRIKSFRLKRNLSSEDYKKFIDNVFDIFFSVDKYIPSFGAIVSDKVFVVVQKMLLHPKKAKIQHQDMYNNASFIALRNQLYGDSTLFKQQKT